jgi:hypothetical protein
VPSSKCPRNAKLEQQRLQGPVVQGYVEFNIKWKPQTFRSMYPTLLLNVQCSMFNLRDSYSYSYSYVNFHHLNAKSATLPSPAPTNPLHTQQYRRAIFGILKPDIPGPPFIQFYPKSPSQTQTQSSSLSQSLPSLPFHPSPLLWPYRQNGLRAESLRHSIIPPSQASSSSSSSSSPSRSRSQRAVDVIPTLRYHHRSFLERYYLLMLRMSIYTSFATCDTKLC